LSVLNLGVLAAALIITAFFLSAKRKRLFFSLQLITLISLSALGTVNAVKIAAQWTEIAARKAAAATPDIQPEYTFSKTGRNVLVIMLDRGSSGYVPFIFEEKPELLSSWSGFTYYPNCVSFGAFTRIGAPPLFGGYEYTLIEMQKRTSETLEKKLKDGFFMLPRLLADNGFSVTTSDIPYVGVRPVYPEDDIRRLYLYDKDFSNFIKKDETIGIFDYYPKITAALLRFSAFKCVPSFLRRFMYDGGEYLSFAKPTFALPRLTLNNYALLYSLPLLTSTTTENASFANIIVNDLAHQPAFLQAPEYMPVSQVSDRGNGPWANDEHYHVNMAVFLLLGKYFDFLKENGVYDNTRIIVVSDHGNRFLKSSLPNAFTLFNGNNMEGYHPLLLVKDFNDTAPLRTNLDFMTNADTPLLATKGLIEDPHNPWTGKPLLADKAAGVTIFNPPFNPNKARANNTYTYAVRNFEWIHVKDNIFVPENWRKGP
jgi:hypothetical protein